VSDREDSTKGTGRGPRAATTHLAYREWASEALGDERQVYARSTNAEDGELVFLPDGAADRFRAAAQAGELVCPVPGCPSSLLTTRGPAERRHHFVHRQAPPDPAHQRAYVRRVATQLLVDWIRVAHPHSTVETDAPVGELSVTVLVTGPASAQFAVVFVDRRLGVDAWWDADLELERADMARSWIFAPRGYLRYPQPTTGATPDDPAIRDRQRGDIVLDRALFREMRGLGKWPLLLNVTTRELANLIAPNGRLARRLRLDPPASRDRVLHLVPARLDQCRLGRDGIETPAVGAAVLAAPRLAAQRHAHLSAAAPEVEHAPAGPELERHPIEAQAFDQARRAAQAQLAPWLAEAQSRVPPHGCGVPTASAPGAAPEPLASGEQDWPCDLDALRRLLGDEHLAQRLEQPLSTDVACDVPPAIWHLMAVLELRHRSGDAHPLAIRAAIVRHCGYSLTGEAIGGVFAVARDTP
jgi:hypothetical protein